MDDQRLSETMKRLGIREQDITEKFVRSAGPGGQNVNKTSTCVYLRHEPTGIEVKCGQERSQAQNRETARRLLAGKIGLRLDAERAQRRALHEKLRRQKRVRSRAAKARMLEQKKLRGRTKELRRKVSDF
jgi:peptide chain release factor